MRRASSVHRATSMHRGALAILLTAWSQGCYAYRTPATTGALPQSARVELRSTSPFAVRLSVERRPAEVVCHATLVRGSVRQLWGDTLLLDLSSAPTSAAEPDGGTRACPRRGEVLVERNAAAQLTQSTLDRTRTALLLLGIVVVVVGFAAYAASQIDVPLDFGCLFDCGPP